MKLSNLNPIYKKLRYGSIGINGQMGYDNYLSSVKNQFCEDNISTHPDSTIVYDLNGDYESLSIKCALNDTSDFFARADFLIYADSYLVASALNVGKGEIRSIDVNLNKCKKITLKITTNKPEFCHAIWFDGILHNDTQDYINGCMGDIQIFRPEDKSFYELCFCICLTPEYLNYAYSLLTSIKENSNLKKYKIILFSFNTNHEIQKLVKDFDCSLIQCQTDRKDSFLLKTCLYSAAKLINSSHYILIDVDTMVCKPLNELYDVIKAANKKSILVTREQSTHIGKSIGHLICANEWPYFGDESANFKLQLDEHLHNYKFVCNGGLIAGSRLSILALDDMIRTFMPGSNVWEKENENVKWREQAILNLSLAKLNNIIELDNKYNFQLLHSQMSESEDAVILHFNGEYGKKQYKNYKFKKYYIQDIPENDFFDKVKILNQSLDLNILDKINIQLLLEQDLSKYKNILVINDKYNFYSAYIIANHDKEVCSTNSKEIIDLIDFLKVDNKFKTVNIKENQNKFDCVIICASEAEHINLSYCLISLDLIDNSGAIFVIENVYQEQKLKDRLIYKNIIIEDFGTYFQISRD